jgi:hypothetical protein
MDLRQRIVNGSWAGVSARRLRRLSRRTFLAGTAGAAGLAATSSLWLPTQVGADDDDRAVVAPRPIPQTIDPSLPFHIISSGPDTEPSTITDFEGTIGVATSFGTGVGFTNGVRGDFTQVLDVRFMQGKYIGVDGHQHHGTFAFV